MLSNAAKTDQFLQFHKKSIDSRVTIIIILIHKIIMDGPREQNQ